MFARSMIWFTRCWTAIEPTNQSQRVIDADARRRPIAGAGLEHGRPRVRPPLTGVDRSRELRRGPPGSHESSNAEIVVDLPPRSVRGAQHVALGTSKSSRSRAIRDP